MFTDKAFHFGVAGAGAWGTALAIVAAQSAEKVTLWSHEQDHVEDMQKARENKLFLPGIPFANHIEITADLADFASCDAILIVTPAQVVSDFSRRLAEYITDTPLIIASKGIDLHSQALMSELFQKAMPTAPLAVLSGPNFADEVAQLLPAATTLACEDEVLGQALCQQLGCRSFRPYYSDDLIGAQISGALKNVLAIAAGIALGKGLGENAKAAVITRGIHEIGALCKAKGGKPESLLGLAGVGDIMLTCGHLKSRNMSLGYALGQGKTLEEILASRHSVTEGVATAQSAYDLSRQLGVDMPICNAVKALLYDGVTIDEVIDSLLSRPLGREGVQGWD